MLLGLIAMLYILLNILRFALRNLNMDFENTVLKIYCRFSISANRHETLKDFNSFADAELLEILHHVSTRWLSLPPFIERVFTHTWKALCSHFLSRPTNCSKQLIKIFSTD